MHVNALDCYNKVRAQGELAYEFRGGTHAATNLTGEDIQRLLKYQAHNRTGQYFESQIIRDVGMWVGACLSDDTGFVARVFTLIKCGGLLVQQKKKWHTWLSLNQPIAVALSHGGRILVEIPSGTENGFFDWLTNQGRAVVPRVAATHNVSKCGTPEALPEKRYRYHDEIGGFSGKVHGLRSALKVGRGSHFGFNLALGGAGNRNPWSGRQISANGGAGHLYLYYLAPTASDHGAMLIGCESSAPSDVKKRLGSPKTVPQTGGVHTKTGTKNMFSATGGLKFSKNLIEGTDGPEPWHTCGSDKEYGGMVIDLVTTGHTFLLNQSFKVDDFGTSGNPPMPPKRR
ncbi:MAG TPA: hypothetical protein VH436_31195 [Vicinamibacterales bacterium]|jgi:hypothetical protein